MVPDFAESLASSREAPAPLDEAVLSATTAAQLDDNVADVDDTQLQRNAALAKIDAAELSGAVSGEQAVAMRIQIMTEVAGDAGEPVDSIETPTSASPCIDDPWQSAQRDCIGTPDAPHLGAGLWDAVMDGSGILPITRRAMQLDTESSSALIALFKAAGKGLVPPATLGDSKPATVIRTAASQWLRAVKLVVSKELFAELGARAPHAMARRTPLQRPQPLRVARPVVPLNTVPPCQANHQPFQPHKRVRSPTYGDSLTPQRGHRAAPPVQRLQTPPRERRTSPARGNRCFVCEKIGHIAAKCPQRCPPAARGRAPVVTGTSRGRGGSLGFRR
jgi:hypothetical protein